MKISKRLSIFFGKREILILGESLMLEKLIE